MLIVSLIAPGIACLLPAHQTAAEKACCQRMHGECGAMHMAVSQSCCQMKAQDSQIPIVQPATVLPLAADNLAVASAPLAFRPPAAFSAVQVPVASSHPPPILRI